MENDLNNPPLFAVTEHEDLRIPMPDGTILSARVWLPSGAPGPVPAVLEYLPYRKRDGTCARDHLTHPYFAARGVAGVRVDMRGNGDSDGIMADEYTAQELQDACDVIAWLADQDWCNGSVGMMGISWGGFNGLQVAALQPPALKAVITLCSTVDRFADDIHYKGGALLNENLGWGATMWSYSSRAPDPALVGDRWRQMWLDRLQAEPFLPSLWLSHQSRDAYWQHGSVCENYSAIAIPVLAVGGWGDAYKNAVPAIVDNLGPSAKGIIGPWVHKYPHFAVPEPRIGFLQEALRWWRKWLMDEDTGVESDPDLTVYLMDGLPPATWYDHRPGRWVTVSSERVQTQTLSLSDNGLSAGPAAPLQAQISSPAHCGMEGGEYCAIWLGPEMAGDQRADDALSLCFDGAPLAQDLDIVGEPRLRLRLSADQAQGQIAVRLNHILPDGAVSRITYGVLNLAHRDGSATPQPMPVGDMVDVTVTLDHIAMRIPAGHRLRVAISTAYWPLIWPAPNPVTLTVGSGDLALPILQGAPASDERVFPPPAAAAPWQVEEIRPASNSRRVVKDMGSGDITLEIHDDFGARRDLAHGLESGSIARERWIIHPDNPQSARGVTHWTQTHGRGDWQLRTETHAQMHCDGDYFYLEAELFAFEGDRQVFHKKLSDKIKRECL